MCNCQKIIMEKLKKEFPDATYIWGQYEPYSGSSYLQFEIKLPDNQKPLKKLLLNTYCPYCGEKYLNDEEME